MAYGKTVDSNEDTTVLHLAIILILFQDHPQWQHKELNGQNNNDKLMA